jgi:hypothetical protein
MGSATGESSDAAERARAEMKKQHMYNRKGVKQAAMNMSSPTFQARWIPCRLRSPRIPTMRVWRHVKNSLASLEICPLPVRHDIPWYCNARHSSILTVDWRAQDINFCSDGDAASISGGMDRSSHSVQQTLMPLAGSAFAHRTPIQRRRHRDGVQLGVLQANLQILKPHCVPAQCFHWKCWKLSSTSAVFLTFKQCSLSS